MSTRKTPGGKGGRCVRVTTLPPSQRRKSRRSSSLNLPDPQGPAQACSGKILPFPFTAVLLHTSPTLNPTDDLQCQQSFRVRTGHKPHSTSKTYGSFPFILWSLTRTSFLTHFYQNFFWLIHLCSNNYLSRFSFHTSITKDCVHHYGNINYYGIRRE
jgi:hypothetical protein